MIEQEKKSSVGILARIIAAAKGAGTSLAKSYGRTGQAILQHGKKEPLDAIFAGGTMLAATPVIGGALPKWLSPYGHIGENMKPIGVTIGKDVKNPPTGFETSRNMVFNRDYNKPIMKAAGVTMFTKEDIRRGMAIRRGLEKSATAVEKTASGGGSLPQLAKQMLLYSAFGTAMGAGGPLAMYGIGQVVKSSRKKDENKNFKKVIKADPSLKKEEDAKKFYGILHRTSPYIAREPDVAAKIIKHMINLPEVTPQTFQQVIQLERGLQDTEMPFFRHSGGAKGIAFNPAQIEGMPLG